MGSKEVKRDLKLSKRDIKWSRGVKGSKMAQSFAKVCNEGSKGV